MRVRWSDVGPEYREDYDIFHKLVTEHSKQWDDITLNLFIQLQGVINLAKAVQNFTSLTELRFSLPSCTRPKEFVEDRWPLRSHWFDTTDLCNNSGFEPITLPSLLDLSLDLEAFHNSTPAVVPILKLLKLPSLSSLTVLMSHSSHKDQIWELLGNMLERSSHPPLKSLFTSYHSISVSDRFDTEGILKHTPQLESASGLYFGYGRWRLLGETVRNASGYPRFKYVPNLRKINLDEIENYEAEELGLILLARWKHGEGPLQKVKVVGQRKYLYGFMEMAQSKLKGLRIEASYH